MLQGQHPKSFFVRPKSYNFSFILQGINSQTLLLSLYAQTHNNAISSWWEKENQDLPASEKKKEVLVPFTIQDGAVYMIWNAAKFYIWKCAIIQVLWESTVCHIFAETEPCRLDFIRHAVYSVYYNKTV